MQNTTRLKELSPMGCAYHLEQLFEHIGQTRMAGIPVLHDKIKVEAIGFQAWQGHVIGLLITPWFMNLMILPGEHDDWSTYQVGSKHMFHFEAGLFEFIVGEEEELGHYMSCSMFSPMFEFADHGAACTTGQAIITGLFDAENLEVLKGEDLNGEQGVSGDEGETSHGFASLSEGLLDGVQAVGEAAHENMNKPMSRRDLLRANFLRPKQNEKQNKGEGSVTKLESN